MTENFVTVDVRDVEVGDRLAGQAGWPEIASILLDCSDGLWWIFADADGTVIARKRVDSRVQIVRDRVARFRRVRFDVDPPIVEEASTIAGPWTRSEGLHVGGTP